MIIKEFEKRLCAIGKSMEVKLPEEGLKLDPRVNDPHYARFSIRYHDDGITVTLTRLDDVDVDFWDDEDEFTMRLYDPETETVPDFTSTIYVYWGLPRELAPSDTTLVIIPPSVKIIQTCAFHYCSKLRRVIMDENVETIEHGAFGSCRSLDALFLPSSIKKIDHCAFAGCPNLRILSIPQTIVIDKIGEGIIYNCDTLFLINQIPHYEIDAYGSIINNDQVHQAFIDFNHNLHPLHKVCLNTNVSAQSIRQCIDTHGIAAAYNTDYGDGMTPMHILALNPHADTGAILTLFHANMTAIFQPYREGYGGDDNYLGGKTPFDIMGISENVSSNNNSNADMDADEDADNTYLAVVAALCKHREETHHKFSTVAVKVQGTSMAKLRSADDDDDHNDDHALKRQKVD